MGLHYQTNTNAIPTIPNIAGLQIYTGSADRLFVLGHTAEDDMGGGEFYYDSSDNSTADDNGFVVVDSSSRRWKRVPPVEVLPQMYGGFAGSTPIGPEVNLAANKAKELGIKLHFTGYGPYTFDPEADGSVSIQMANGESSVIYGDIYTVLKFRDGMPNTAGKFWHILYWVSRTGSPDVGQHAELIHCSGLVCDGNFRTIAAPPVDPGDVQQRTFLKVLAEPTTDNFIRKVIFEDIVQVDPIADTISFGDSSTTLVDTNADALVDSPSIGSATINRFHAGIRTGVRSTISMGSSVGNVHIEDFTCDQAIPGGERNSIEIEYTQGNIYKKTIKLVNVEVDDLEFGGGPTVDLTPTTVIELVNVESRRFAFFDFVDVKAINCIFYISTGTVWKILSGEFVNCLYRHTVFDDLGVDEIHALTLYADLAYPSNYKEIGCVHEVVGTIGVGAIHAMVQTHVIAGETFGDHEATFTNCVFDPATVRSINFYRGGLLRTNNCVFGGTEAGVISGELEGKDGSWISNNDDFTLCAKPFYLLSTAVGNATSLVEINGGRYNDGDWIGVGPTTDTLVSLSTRKLLVSTTPTGGGLYGDISYLDAVGYSAAVSTDPIEWLCVDAHPTAATWIQTKQKP